MRSPDWRPEGHGAAGVGPGQGSWAPVPLDLGEGSESRAGREDGKMPADRARGWGPAAGVGRGEGGVVWTRGVYSPALGH